jgi:hypothetical protein
MSCCKLQSIPIPTLNKYTLELNFSSHKPAYSIFSIFSQDQAKNIVNGQAAAGKPAAEKQHC